MTRFTGCVYWLDVNKEFYHWHINLHRSFHCLQDNKQVTVGLGHPQLIKTEIQSFLPSDSSDKDTCTVIFYLHGKPLGTMALYIYRRELFNCMYGVILLTTMDKLAYNESWIEHH